VPADPNDLEHAINNRLRVRFVYDGQPRVVQPATLGRHAITGALSLRGYQTGGRSNSRPPPFWTVFSLERMVGLEVVDDPFVEDPPGYRNGDRHIEPVIVQL
jgi:hypothetical protein